MMKTVFIIDLKKISKRVLFYPFTPSILFIISILIHHFIYDRFLSGLYLVAGLIILIVQSINWAQKRR